ncbi:hypothetical protein SDC9_145632 [bioreactor metagenome]|uniref:Uncharacterized protein n=1 Tax=bioreactor metagenome TaxID=1076179 RepID=A0A645E9Z7_9ZZZZ
MTGRFKAFVIGLLNVFPDGVAIRADDHKALNWGVIAQLCFRDNVCIPLWKIDFHWCNFFNLIILFFTHCKILSYSNSHETIITQVAWLKNAEIKKSAMEQAHSTLFFVFYKS